MKRYIKVNVDTGRIEHIVSSIDSGYIENGYIEITSPELNNISDSTLLTQYQYKNDQLVNIGLPPSLNYTVTLNGWEFDLERSKLLKSTQMNLACQNTIYAGYDSDALGSTHHYPAKDRDQSNMIASVTSSLNPDNLPTWTIKFWCADSEGVWDLREHTAAQIRKAGSDGNLTKALAIDKNKALQDQIAQATTQEELDAIIFRSHNE
jgi:hypothetical protein